MLATTLHSSLSGIPFAKPTKTISNTLGILKNRRKLRKHNDQL